jgi:polyhydroxybutyrate depolymerase
VLLLALSTASCNFNPNPALPPGDHDRELRHNGIDRTYRLHVPSQYDGTAPLPLVFMLHGGFGDALGAATHYGWTEKSDAESFFAVFHDGTGRIKAWNAGHCCGAPLAFDIDDAGFIAELLDELKQLVNVDARRVYATGMSNGAMLAYRLAAQRPDLFAAIAPVAGTLGGQVNAQSPLDVPSPPASPVPVIMFHGTADLSIRYEGGLTDGVAAERIDLSQEECVQYWVHANGCDPAPQTTELAEGRVIRRAHAAVGNQADVIHYTLVGQGHAWPGGIQPWPGADLPGTDIVATDLIWTFFKSHAHP